MVTPDNHNSPNKELREEELQTEGPLSEKDEVKKAEEQTGKPQGDMQPSVTGGLKSREGQYDPEQDK